MWEQLDQEVQFTPTRKLFTLVPVFLYVTLLLVSVVFSLVDQSSSFSLFSLSLSLSFSLSLFLSLSLSFSLSLLIR